MPIILNFPRTQKIANKNIPLRKYLHQHPQTAFEETIAQDIITTRLDELELRYNNNVAKTGVVAIIEGTAQSGDSNRMIALRVDMDALNTSGNEQTGVPHAPDYDANPHYNNKMHACGHDGHTIAGLTAVEWLANNRDQFSGIVHFIFQPAEEAAGGAETMLKDGLFTKHPAHHIHGSHNWPDLLVGQAIVHNDPKTMQGGGYPVMAGSAYYDMIFTEDEPDIQIDVPRVYGWHYIITASGDQGHAGKSERFKAFATDAIAEAHLEIQKLAEKFNDESQVIYPAHLIKAGQYKALNSIPETAMLKGFIAGTANDDDVKSSIDQILKDVANKHGANIHLEWEEASVPQTKTSPKATTALAEATLAIKALEAEYQGDHTVVSRSYLDSNQVSGTIRTYDPQNNTDIEARLNVIAATIANEYSVDYKLDWQAGSMPTLNDPQLAQDSYEIAKRTFGAKNVNPHGAPVGAHTAEDFGTMATLSGKPATYIWIGNGDANDPQNRHNKPLHDRRYEFNDKALAAIAEYYTHVVTYHLAPDLVVA